ncbi:MAG: Uma2 family endonuclease [Acidimicrobiia bacterium]|nr:Uma2 family endonuclease [Acidimicrobiia bacterium]
MNESPWIGKRTSRSAPKYAASTSMANFDVLSEWAWKPATDEFIPDVIVFDRTEDQPRLGPVPHLAVEVLSNEPARDMIRKFHKYASAGLQHYWIIDPDEPTIIVYALRDGTYIETGRHPAGTLATLDIGVLHLSIDPIDLIA